jgi:hypothetical protein
MCSAFARAVVLFSLLMAAGSACSGDDAASPTGTARAAVSRAATRDSWRNAAPLTVGRWFHQVVALSKRRALIVGGDGVTNGEILDLATNQTVVTPGLAALGTPDLPFRCAWSAVLPGAPERVLLVGSGALGAAGLPPDPRSYIYDVDHDTLTPTGDQPIETSTSANMTRAVVFPDGRVFIAGGFLDLTFIDGVPVWPISDASTLFDPHAIDPATGRRGRWDVTRDAGGNPTHMVVPMVSHDMVLMNDGRVLVVGGQAARHVDAALNTQIFDPGSGTWSAPDSIQIPNVPGLPGEDGGPGRNQTHLAQLPDGRVLAAGGFSFSSDWVRQTAFVFDPRDDRWTRVGDLDGGTAFAMFLTAKTGGAIYVVGGGDNSDFGETARVAVFDPRRLGFATVAPMPTVDGELQAGWPAPVPEVDFFAWNGAVLSSGEFLLSGGAFDFGTGESPARRNQVYTPASETHSLPLD